MQKRLNALNKNDNKTVWYRLEIMTDYLHQGEKLYQTPDAALSDIYMDAHRRKAAYIAVICFPFSQGNLRGVDIGYVWGVSKSGTLAITPESEGTSFVYCLGDYGTHCNDLSYPNEKPEREFIDILIDVELDWIQRVAKCASVEEYVRRKQLENPESYSPEWQTDTQKLKQLYESQ